MSCLFILASMMEQIFSHIWETEPTNLKIGLELLRAVKEELDLHPSRTSLDFLLSTCAKVKDSQHAWFIWLEYGIAGLPYNVLTFLRFVMSLLRPLMLIILSFRNLQCILKYSCLFRITCSKVNII